MVDMHDASSKELILGMSQDGGFSYDHLRDILSSGNELESLYRLQSADAVTVINGLERVSTKRSLHAINDAP